MANIKLLLLLTFCLLFQFQIYSQIQNGEVLLRGDYIEVGISDCGSFGTEFNFPNSHHRNNYNSGIGFVADPHKDGWNVGTPNFYGDFFLPGTPAEGWGIQFTKEDSTYTYVNQNIGSICMPTQILGKNFDYENSEEIVMASWKSKDEFNNDNNLSICKTVYVDKDDVSFIINVTICNTSQEVIHDFYYVRSVDPDNDVSFAPPGANLNGWYHTDNKILFQPPGSNRAVITAIGTDHLVNGETINYNSFLALGANSSNARVAIRNSGLALPENLSDVWSGTGEYHTNGSLADVGIALAFKFEAIQPGQCINFSYTYVLDLADLEKAIGSTDDNFSIVANGSDISNSGEISVAQSSNLNLQILSNPGYIWTWVPNDESGNLTGNSQQLNLSEPRTYTITGAYNHGCYSNTISTSIQIKIIKDEPCADCIPSFSPIQGKEYLLSAWVKEDYLDKVPHTYDQSGILVYFDDDKENGIVMRPSGPIVDGWQRVEVSFTIPENAGDINIALLNEKVVGDVYFDDIRIHPFQSNMKSFVYDPSTQRLVAELDENNYATKYEYDDEGILIRVKKETERGVMTIKETRNNQSKLHIK